MSEIMKLNIIYNVFILVKYIEETSFGIIIIRYKIICSL
jgi:hypothetical protein